MTPRCRNGHPKTKENTQRIFSHGRETDRCLVCHRLAKLRRKRQARPTKLSKLEAQRELLRTKVYAMPECEYRTKMLEAFAAFDAFEATDKRPARFGRKYPQQKAVTKKRRAA